MKKFSKKVLFCGMTALIAAAFIACSDGGTTDNSTPDNPPPPPPPPPPVVPFSAEGNILMNGDADDTDVNERFPATLRSESGCTFEQVEGGVNGTKCWKVSQNSLEAWSGEFGVDLTSFYGPGKNYLISFCLKADPEPEKNYLSEDEVLHVSYSAYSGAVKEWAIANKKEHYDFDDSFEPGPWGGDFTDDAQFLSAIPEGEEFSTEGVEATDKWKRYFFVIPASELKTKCDDMKGMYNFGLSLAMSESAIGYYSYLIDEIIIKDLNPELPRTGITWVDPNAPEEPEEGEEE